MTDIWKAETFEIALLSGPHAIAGYTYRGLGLHFVSKASPKGRRPVRWALIHLGTGHCMAYLDGDVITAFPVATEIAEAGDWDFLSLQGWKDKFPDGREKLEEVCARHPKIATMTLSGKGGSHLAVAQQIAANRP